MGRKETESTDFSISIESRLNRNCLLLLILSLFNRKVEYKSDFMHVFANFQEKPVEISCKFPKTRWRRVSIGIVTLAVNINSAFELVFLYVFFQITNYNLEKYNL